MYLSYLEWVGQYISADVESYFQCIKEFDSSVKSALSYDHYKNYVCENRIEGNILDLEDRDIARKNLKAAYDSALLEAAGDDPNARMDIMTNEVRLMQEFLDYRNSLLEHVSELMHKGMFEESIEFMKTMMEYEEFVFHKMIEQGNPKEEDESKSVNEMFFENLMELYCDSDYFPFVIVHNLVKGGVANAGYIG